MDSLNKFLSNFPDPSADNENLCNHPTNHNPDMSLPPYNPQIGSYSYGLGGPPFAFGGAPHLNPGPRGYGGSHQYNITLGGYPPYNTAPGGYPPYNTVLGGHPPYGHHGYGNNDIPWNSGGVATQGHSLNSSVGDSISPDVSISRARKSIDLPQTGLDQINLDAEFNYENVPAAREGVTARSRNIWDTEDRVRLISAWLKHSLDAKIGIDQNARDFWEKITDEYNKTAPPHEQRTLSSLKTYWGHLHRATSKFLGHYECASRNRTSGASEDDVMRQAHILYERMPYDKVPKYIFKSVFDILRNEPKWLAYQGVLHASSDGSSEKRTKNSEDGTYTSSGGTDSFVPGYGRVQRPTGRDAAKKEKGKATATTSRKGKGKATTTNQEKQPNEEIVELLKNSTKKAEALVRANLMKNYQKLAEKREKQGYLSKYEQPFFEDYLAQLGYKVGGDDDQE